MASALMYVTDDISSLSLGIHTIETVEHNYPLKVGWKTL